MNSLFPRGLNGLSDSKWSGTQGSVSKLVGIDIHSTPGLIKVHQKLSKHSGETIDELCKNKVACSDGSNLWFSSESGKIWREVGGVYTLVHTTTTAITDPISRNQATVAGKLEISQTASNAGVGQSFMGDGRKVLDATFQLKKAGSPTGNAVAKIYAHTGTFGTNGTPTGSALATSDNLDVSTLTASYQSIKFTFTGAEQITLSDGTAYFVTVEYSDGTSGVNELEIGIASGALTHPGNVATLFDSSWGSQSFDLVFSINAASPVKILGAEEFSGYIYWATKNALHRIAIFFIDDWTKAQQDFGAFDQGDDEFHPMVKQNFSLFIGDNTVIAEVTAIAGIHTFLPIANTNNPLTSFRVQKPERIQTLIDFDIDILIGTKEGTKGRVLRWDTVSESWGAEDVVEEDGINAFIRDDNFVYVSAGSYGRLYFYNGEKLEPYKRIPGDWTPSKKAKINPSAVGFLLGVPVFGLSNIAGNPTLQGVYSFGSYSVNYPKVLDLSFPVSSGEFEDVEIGAIIVRGADLYVAYKDGEDVGVDKLDYEAKYENAYFETTLLSAPTERDYLKTVTKVFAPYASLPEDTAVTVGHKRKYDANYTSIPTKANDRLHQVEATQSIPDIANFQLRIGFETDGNNAPEIEGISIKQEQIKQ